jgi:hypothetical protein
MKPAAHPSHTLWNPFSPLAALAVFKPSGTALRAGTRSLRNSSQQPLTVRSTIRVIGPETTYIGSIKHYSVGHDSLLIEGKHTSDTNTSLHRGTEFF